MTKQTFDKKGRALVTKYDNRLNSVNISSLNSLEINIFFLALYKTMQHKVAEVEIPYDEVVSIAGLPKDNPLYVYSLLQQTKKKIGRLDLNVLSDAMYDDTIWLFSRWKNDGKQKVLTLSFSDKYIWMINDVRKNFTSFDVRELITLKSKFSKMLFIRLKQWKTVGSYEPAFQAFRQIMGIPQSCPDRNVLSKYIKPAVREICDTCVSFRELSVSPCYDGREHRLSSIRFSWTPETLSRAEHGRHNLDDENKNTVKYTLGDEVLSESDYDALVQKYSADAVDAVIYKIMDNHYYGCLNTALLEVWLSEDGNAEKEEIMSDNILLDVC